MHSTTNKLLERANEIAKELIFCEDPKPESLRRISILGSRGSDCSRRPLDNEKNTKFTRGTNPYGVQETVNVKKVTNDFSHQCGPNAECRHEVFRGDAAETLCVCTEGFTGDPDDHTQGCKKSDEKSLGPSGSSGGGGDGRVGDGDGGGSNGVRRPAAASGGEGWPKAATDGEGSKAAG